LERATDRPSEHLSDEHVFEYLGRSWLPRAPNYTQG
jgi:hypothetical protein